MPQHLLFALFEIMDPMLFDLMYVIVLIYAIAIIVTTAVMVIMSVIAILAVIQQHLLFHLIFHDY